MASPVNLMSGVLKPLILFLNSSLSDQGKSTYGELREAPFFFAVHSTSHTCKYFKQLLEQHFPEVVVSEEMF